MNRNVLPLAVGSLLRGLLVAAYGLGLAGSCFAGERSYDCIVTEQWLLGKEGTLQRSHLFDGVTFSINRDTGEIRSREMLKQFPKMQILWRGTPDHYFLAQAIATPLWETNGKVVVWPLVQFLRIDEFRPGTTKAFFLYDVADIKTGVCR